MQAGLLRDIITFQESQQIVDNLGGRSSKWVDKVKKRAWVRFKSGARKYQNSEIINTNTVTIIIRYCKDVNEKMRIVYQGQKYVVAFIHPDVVRQQITIEAELINE